MAPWTVWWQRNFFADLLPWIRPLMASSAVRVAVVATGVVTAAAGMNDLKDVVFRRLAHRRRPANEPVPKL